MIVDLLAVILPVLTGALILLITLSVARFLSKRSKNEDFSARLAQIYESEVETNEIIEVDAGKGWQRYWYILATQSGALPLAARVAGRNAILWGLVIFGFGALVVPGNVVMGVGMGVGAIACYRAMLNFRIAQRKKRLNAQLPLLISNMRANLQANSTPERALLSVVDDIAEPLHTELSILRDEINVGVPLEPALNNLARRVPSQEMKFMVASVEIASRSGADLDPQLKTIQGIITARARTASRLATAVASVTPSIWIAAVFIPGAFLFSWFSSEENRAFWSSLWGFAALAVTGLLYVGGLLTMQRLVKNVENT